MKKKAVEVKTGGANEKSFFRQTGEVIGSIGAHIANATDHIVEFVASEVTHAKKALKKSPVTKLVKTTPKSKHTKRSGAKKVKKSAVAKGKRRTAGAKH
jgi:hypothetical protein